MYLLNMENVFSTDWWKDYEAGKPFTNLAPVKPFVPYECAGLVLFAGKSSYLRRFVVIRAASYIVGTKIPFGGAAWTLPKGRVDAGETLREAAIRETFEETGIRATTMRAGYVGKYRGVTSITHYMVGFLERAEALPHFETREVRIVTVERACRIFRACRNFRDAAAVEDACELVR